MNEANCLNDKITPSIISIDEMTEQSDSQNSGFLLLDEPENEAMPIVNGYNDSEQYEIPLTSINHEHFFYPSPNYQRFRKSVVLFQFCYCYLITRFFSNSWFLINLLTVDSVVSSTVYLAEYYGLTVSPYLSLETTIKRYCYFVIATFLFYNLSSLLWIDQSLLFSDITYGFFKINLYNLSIILISMPYLINRAINFELFRKTYFFVSNEIYFLTKYIISKKIAGLVNRIGVQYLNRHPKLKPEELVDVIDRINFRHLASFIGSCLLASLLFYFELDGAKIYTILFRQYYFREYFMGKEELNLNDRSYIINIITNRDWSKLVDPYTLNRLMKFYLQLNESTNGGLLQGQNSSFHVFKQAFKKFTINWTVYSLIGYRSSGIWTYLLYLWRDNGKFLTIKLVTILLYLILSLNSNEQVLFLAILELNLILVANPAFISILKDIKDVIGRELKGVELYQAPSLSKMFYFLNIGYWLIYSLVYYYCYHWELIVIMILGWITFRLKYFYYSWSTIGLMVIANIWSIISHVHPFHLFLLNTNIDFLRIFWLK